MSNERPAAADRSCARVIRLASVSPERELGIVAGLVQAAGTSALVIAGLEGDAASLGRFQRPGRSRAARELRRLSGGRSTRYGDGMLSLCALAPTAQAWLDEPGVLSGPRLLNRLVRGLLAGLGGLGLPASYPGRDFVSVNGRRIAYVSLSREPSGVLLFQAVLAVGGPYTTEEHEPRFPGLPGAPEPTWIAREREPAPDFERISAALEAGFADRLALELEDAPLSADEERAFATATPPPLVDPALEGLSCAGPIETPIGELEAHVRLDVAGRLACVRLRGDWIASQPELRALEASLVGGLPESARVRERCAAWLAEPASLVVGLTEAGAIADAIARSARAYSVDPGASSSA